ncbi:MAG: beta family protein [Gemmatimonadota bacterium]|nr:beta family protein [Gemmatimonadota bacterium]
MTFGSRHYVPVLKVKRAEKSALQLVALTLREHVTPLLEIVEWRKRQDKPTLRSHLDTAFKDLAKSLRWYPRCFLDARELARQGPSAAEQIFNRAADAGIPFIPVTGITKRADASAAVRNQERGLAIRLTRDDFEAGDLSSGLSAFMARHGIEREDADLILDLGPVEDMVTEGVARLASQFLGDVPDRNRWRTLIVSASAFPKSMGVVDRDSHAVVTRVEWLAWKRLRDGGRFSRVPTYSDCAIQHPSGVEGFDPRMMQVSASVRYALADSWLLIKGKGTRRHPARMQFPQLAKRLAYGYLCDHFRGEAHCEGCASIKRAADGQPRLGSPEVWRRIGTVHHITEVMRTLRSLPGS